MTKTEIEYEESPSGFVTFYNYKEPLMKFDEGFGYVGALVFDGNTDKIQCHFCGEWLGSLPHHLKREHNMSASEYKERVGLFQNTALISESARAKLIASGLDKRLQNLRAGGKKTEEQKEKIRATLIENGKKPEGKNLRGTCPAQLIDRLQKIYREKGEQMNMRDISSMREMLKRTFGSMHQACAIAGVPYNAPGFNRSEKKYTEEDALNFIKEFIARFDRIPKFKDFKLEGKKGLYVARINSFKKLKELSTIAYAGMEEYKKNGERINYSKEQLLDFLRKFEEINGRRPAVSDGKRCLIPYPSRYYYHFGTWKEALRLAFNQTV